jgi:hypothetical protein
MTPFELATLEASRRVEVMPSEFEVWQQAASGNVDGMGIHKSQLVTLGDLLESLAQRQRDLLANRPPAAASMAYAQAELDLTDQVIGAYELWSAFRAVFELRREERFRRSLDAADLVAASAYRTAMAQAEAWNVVTADQHREPPLVCAEAVGSPATAARGSRVSGLSGTIRRFRSELTPIPLVLFPADRLDDPWTYASLAHEVGHDLEADLAFTTEAVGAGIDRLSAAGVVQARLDAWQAWGPEVVADAVGVALGGAGFAAGLAAWLHSVALAGLFAQPNGDRHPPPHIRLRLLEGLLRASSIPGWIPLADELDAGLAAAAVPSWQQPFDQDALEFAEAVLCTQLTAFKGHAVVDLAPNLAGDAAAAEQLSKFMRTGLVRTPTPQGPPPFPSRLVPAAAALAVREAAATAELLELVKERTLTYILDIPRPEFLAAAPAGRRAYLRGLAARLDVRPEPAEI